MERMRVDYILIHRLMFNRWLCHLEFESFLSTWGAVTVSTLCGGAIMLHVE